MTMTSERRVSVHDMTSCDSMASSAAAMHADRRSRSVDSGLVTDVDLPQRALTALAGVERSSSVRHGATVVGSCDSGLVEQDSTQELADRTIVCGCSTVSSPAGAGSLTPQRSDDVACRTFDSQSSPVSAAVINNRQSWLLRLFESKLFDMSIAIQYLFNSKESGVQTYIGKSSGCVRNKLNKLAVF